MLTDHDTIEGSLALRREVERQSVTLEVPIAAEYKTSHGDVIAAFIEREIESRDLADFVAEVREQGGFLLLPHPYDNHRDVETLAQSMDLIEVFNARASVEHNAASLELARHTGKRAYWAPDAHIPSTLAKVLITVERVGSLRDSLLNGAIEPLRALPASRADLWLSQYVKAFKTRRPRLFVEHSMSIVLSLLRQAMR
jgi:predicted metal-dependent phosphoesterase TrpH